MLCPTFLYVLVVNVVFVARVMSVVNTCGVVVVRLVCPHTSRLPALFVVYIFISLTFSTSCAM